MFQLRVVGQDEANHLIENLLWPTRIVSLLADDRQLRGLHHLHVRVDDVGFMAHHANYPTMAHLQRVLDFTYDLQDDDRLLVHCHAGMSRSTAIAIAICIQHGMSYREAFEHVAATRPILMPNELFIKHIDGYFDLGNKLVEHVAAHRAEVTCRPHTLIIPPTVEDIERMQALLDILRP